MSQKITTKSFLQEIYVDEDLILELDFDLDIYVKSGAQSDMDIDIDTEYDVENDKILIKATIINPPNPPTNSPTDDNI